MERTYERRKRRSLHHHILRHAGVEKGALVVHGDVEGEPRRLGRWRAAGEQAWIGSIVGKGEAHVERDLLGYGTLVTTP